MDRLLELLRKLTLVVVNLLGYGCLLLAMVCIAVAVLPMAPVFLVLGIVILFGGPHFVNWLFSYQDKSE
jgi:type IV secretory pathway VirB2 component (pilin)